LIDATLIDQILHQSADWIVGEGSHYGGVETKATLQSSRHVVFAAAFPNFKSSGCVNSACPRIEAQHHLAETYLIPATFIF
jgi:hypothetical protein